MPWDVTGGFSQPWLAGGSSRDWGWSEGVPTFIPVGLPRVAPPILTRAFDWERAALPDVVLGSSGPPIMGVPGTVDLPPGSVDNSEIPGEEDMAIEWGTVFQTGIDVLNRYGQMTSGQVASSFASPTSVPVGTGDPNYNGQAWAQARRCKRRRSRPMLTPTNMALMHQIGTLPNNANVRIALAKAIRKS